MENKYIKLKVTNREKFKFIDYDDEQFIKANGLDGKIVNKDGVKALEWKQNERFTVPVKETDINYVTSIRFSVYSAKATGAQVVVRFLNPPTQATKEVHNGNVYAVQDVIYINFKGWKTFDFTTGSIGGYQARTHHNIVAFELYSNRYSNGSMPDETLYFSDIEMIRDSYELVVPDGLDVNDESLYKTITQNYRDFIIGNESVSCTEAYSSLANKIESSCRNTYALYKETWQGMDKPSTLFNIVVEKKHFGGEEQTMVYYGKVLELAKGYAMPNQSFYKDKELLSAIKNCLEYGYTHYYGPSILEFGVFGNWWEWEIGIPMNLLPSLVLIEDEITPEDCERYLYLHKYLVPYPISKGGNKIWHSRMCIISAALRRSAFDLCITTEYMNDLFNYIDDYADEGGFFEDNSFVQHYHFPYAMGYGGTYIGDLPMILYFLNGTPFYPQEENIKNHFTWIFEAFRPLVYKKRTMSAFAGRNVGRVIREDSRSFASNIILVHTYAPSDVKQKLEDIIASYMQLYNNSFADRVPLCLANYANQLYDRLKNVKVDTYETTKIFGMASRAVHHGENYGICLSLSSTGIQKYEAINDENKVGWYLGDGMIYIYTGDYSFDTNFYSFVNPYLLPGITVNSVKRSIANGSGTFNASPYAGGVEQGKYGSVGFVLDYNGMVHHTYANNETDATLTAKKSYFMFDNEVVCVGSDISDKSGTEVKTVIENRLWSDISALTIGGEEIKELSDIHTVIDEKILHLEGMGGYVILKDDGAKLSYAKVENAYNNTNGYNGKKLPEAQTGTREFFELYLTHGIGDSASGRIENDKYFYAYLPSATVEETIAYSANPDVALLRRDSNAHAVLENKLGIVAVNFFANATVNIDSTYSNITAVKSITANAPSCVMISNTNEGNYVISVSEPTCTYSSISFDIQIEGVTQIVSSDENLNVSINEGTVSVTANTEKALRRTYTFTVN